MATLIYNQKGCIGAGECENIHPRFWQVKDGKAALQGSVLNSQDEHELPIFEEEIALHQRVASNCPAGCIKIKV